MIIKSGECKIGASHTYKHRQNGAPLANLNNLQNERCKRLGIKILWMGIGSSFLKEFSLESFPMLDQVP